jgi:four helix bundle protein
MPHAVMQTNAPVDLKIRTRDFALRVIRLYASLPKSVEAQVIGKQMLRAGTSVGANYREGLRARSRPEYATKLNISFQPLPEEFDRSLNACDHSKSVS